MNAGMAVLRHQNTILHVNTQDKFDSQKALNMRKQRTGETKAKHCYILIPYVRQG